MLKVLTALIVMLTFVAGCGESPATTQASGVPDGIQQRPSTKPVTATISRSDEASDVQDGPSAGLRDANWKQIGQLIGHSQPIKTLAFLPDSDRLVSGSFDGALKVWDTKTLQEVKSIKAHDGNLSMFALSPDGKRLASGDFGGSEKNLIKIWDTSTWNCVATSRAGPILYCIAFSPDGATLATTGGKTIEFWRITEQKELKKLKQIDVGIWPISGLAFSPDGRTLFLAGMDNIDNTFAAGEGGALRAYDVESFEMVGEAKTKHQPAMHALAVSPSGEIAMSCMAEVYGFRWTRHENEIHFEQRYAHSRTQSKNGVLVFEAQYGASAFDARGEWLAVSAGTPGPPFPEVGHVEILNATTGDDVAILVPSSPDKRQSIARVAFSGRGELLAATGAKKTITLWRKSGPAAADMQTAAGMRPAYESPEMAVVKGNQRLVIGDTPIDETHAARRFRLLHEQHQESLRRFQKAAGATQDFAEKTMIGWDILPRPDDYVPKLIDIARRHPEDEAALDALAFSVWLMKGDEAYHLTRERADVLELLTSNHIHDADLSRVFYLLEGTNWAESIEFLRTVLTSSRNANVRAHACFSLGNFFAQRAATARMVRSDGFRRPQPPQSFQPSQLPSDLLQQYTELQQYFDEQKLLLEQTSAEDCVAEAERFYDRVTRDYPDVILRPATYARLRDPENPNIAGWKPRRLGQLAEQARYALHHLSVGQLAPEIKGEDIDGRAFKLSDYRGKVVVLAFSGNWCGACIAMYPQYRDMVERLKDKPFVLLHVNSDSSREELKRSMDDGKITWRSWFDGGSSHGPIATQWQVTGWPVIYVIDDVGVIRYMNLRSEKLDAAVDRLIGLNFEQGR